MKTIKVTNVHQALPVALRVLEQYGVYRDSRNGRVLASTMPVSTVFENPKQRVIFWPERDANPFFHLYESLWMLAGRNDLEPLTRYVSTFGKFSDNGETLHGAYGHRWRCSFDPLDQLAEIADRLQSDPNDRRCVLQMWDAGTDLEHRHGRDLPCNLVATFQVNHLGRLDLVVFCRSNDIVWGAYGANAVHFSFLLEYMCLWTNYPMGTYTQVSVNWHAYEDIFRKLQPMMGSRWAHMIPEPIRNPYEDGIVSRPLGYPDHDHINDVDLSIRKILAHADNGFQDPVPYFCRSFWTTAYAVLRAHDVWRRGSGRERYTDALQVLNDVESESQKERRTDWIVAAREWIERRYNRWLGKESTISAV